MGFSADYALRISNLAKPTDKDPNGRRVNFYFSRNVIPTGCEYVEVSFNMGRIVFVFMKDRISYPKNYAMKRCIKLSESLSTNLRTASCSLIEFIELMKGWEGEYDNLLVFPNSKPESHKFYIKREMRHGYTNIMAGSSAEFTKKADILAEDAKQASIPYDVSKEEVEEEIKPCECKTLEDIEKPDILNMTFNEALLKMRQDEYDLCKDVIGRAEECTRIMANGVITLLEYRLLRRPLSIGEAEANVEFHKIYLKYLKLENAVKDLMTNVRHTWEDGHKLYDAYKKTKEDYPDMGDEDIAKYLHVGPEELHETLEAIKRMEEEKKDEKAKIGFTVEG